jgi:hypothetical protein
MPELFKDIVPSILQTKKNVLEDERDEKYYVPYVVNRALSSHVDCILYVNEMNRLPNTPGLLQYHYLLNSIRPMKRKFLAYQKTEKIADLEYVKEYFGYSNEKAKDALRILNDEQIAYIKQKLDKGGVKK